MNQTFRSTEWITQRNSLDQLDAILRGTVAGEFPDIPEVVNTTHRLREEINQILVSFVESSAAPSEARY